MVTPKVSQREDNLTKRERIGCFDPEVIGGAGGTPPGATG